MSIPYRYHPDRDRAANPSSPLEWLRRIGLWFGIAPFPESAMPRSQIRQSYERPPSFSNFLRFAGHDPEHEVFGLADCTSCAVVLELDAVDAEARSTKQLEDMIFRMTTAFSSIPHRDQDPWIIQLFMQDEPLLEAAHRIRGYAAAIGSELNAFSNHYFDVMQAHLRDIGKPGGIFEDAHTGTRWGGRIRRIRLVVTRRFDARQYPDRSGNWPPHELNAVVRNLVNGLAAAGIDSRRVGPGGLHNWMTAWLNPAPLSYDNAWDYLADHELPDGHAFPEGYDLGQGVLKHCPKSDLENGNWIFDGRPHRYLPVLGFTREPDPGILTLEQSAGRARTAALFDRLPAGTIFACTIVFSPQDAIARRLDFIWKRSRSDNAESRLTNEEVEQCQAAMARGNPIFPATMGFYLQGRDRAELEERMTEVRSICQAAHIDVLDPAVDLFPLDEYIHYLPMGYQPDCDRYLYREKLHFLVNLLAMSPLWGKANGSGKPGFVFYDRSGTPIMLDILHPEDRDKAPHLLLIGPTGTGKSATLNYLALQTMALRKPHLYIVDVGDSFRLLGDHFKHCGLSVHYARLDQANVPLPPFASSGRMLAEQIELQGDPDNDEEQIDFLGEMELAARLIITGADPREEAKYTRPDRTMVRAALIDAARRARASGDRHATISHFVEMLGDYANGTVPYGEEHPVEKQYRKRIQELRDSARYFLDGFRARIFDREGELWPEADVTIVDIGKIAQGDDNKDMLALAFIGLMNAIQRDAERRRGGGRQSVVMIDEAHVTTTNPLLADYLARGSKMWRKWGLWLWLATQNLADFPDDAQKILNMAEFWICLSMPKEEITEVGRFKKLSEEDLLLLAEARKSSGQYSEGVLLSGQPPMLFRNVPPALAMALAQTEETEVAARHRLMKELGLATELDAVYAVAEQIREARLQ